MANSLDIAAVEPALELTLAYRPHAPSLRCVGMLDARTRHHVLDAVDELLRGSPRTIVIDITDLRVTDPADAEVLIEVRRRVQGAGAALHWHGLDSVPDSRADS